MGLETSTPSVRFRLPDPALRRFITAYYFVEVPDGPMGAVADLLHPEWANVRFVLGGHWAMELDGTTYDPAPGAALFGPTSVTGTVRGEAGSVLGIGLLPLGWAQFFTEPAAAFADRVTPLVQVFGDRAEAVYAALNAAGSDDAQVAILDEFFLALAAAGGAPDSLLTRAHDLLIDPAIGSVEALAKALGVSSRHLARLSLRMFGFAPKLLLRRQRFLRTLQELREHPGEGSASLIDAWYYDQSHFVRDFHRFMGMSPSAYFALPHQLLGPAARARMAALGASLQGLHAAE
ncbi:MAG: helix-turn-helix domain-containing protein [Pseudomonadota bacterium]|uniref:AraC family transcriptional regulator n=1 Tax=Phenylobacterium sp. TaxID=1871053 RepID=UPI0025E152B1|nr:helix-turn-helix domain-containing protein [Phenylobacterium sp.]MBT9473926.1 AraC family transcriptional regulator [Phenylobacterium sp.]